MAVETLEPRPDVGAAQPHYQRFNLLHRLLHGVLMLSFLGLVASGMPLRFNTADWAISFARNVGGFDAILLFHKVFAVLLTLVFAVHIGYFLWLAVIRKERGVFYGETSMVPRPKDVTDAVQHFKWFVGKGPRPQFSRWTYWEKFDYIAVFWGMIAIGLTGYVMWFSELAARLLPGWVFNISLLVHSEEALLAAWFIFAIHFFNTHLRPERFPMDDVIFTGCETVEELEESRSAEYQRLVETGLLQQVQRQTPPRWLKNFGRIVGWSVMATGFLLMALTLYAFVTEGEPEAEAALPDRPLVGPATTTTTVITLSWDWDIGPMLADGCSECHAETAIGGLDLRTYESTMAGGVSGPAVVPRNPDASPLLTSQAAGIHFGMLDRTQLDTLAAWITGGAPER